MAWWTYIQERYSSDLSRNSHSQIVHYDQCGFCWKCYHDGVHNWVDGSIARGNLAAYDPKFWCHHSFLDYIWELFRRRIQNAPADYPFGYPSHGPNDLMRFDNYRYRPNPPISNQAGYSNRYARLRQYAPAPSCANDCLNSLDLYCSTNINRCISAVLLSGVQQELVSRAPWAVLMVLLPK